MKADTKRIKIFDTTLRDGQQCPGAGMSFEKNVEYAHLASKLGVDILEAGFPSASNADYKIVETIAAELAPMRSAPVIAALCQLREKQIDNTIEALAPAVPFGKARLHTYVPVDPDLLQASLGSRAENKGEIVNDTARLISKAAAAGVEVQFSPEGYSRMNANFDFTTDLIRAAVDSGASVINCPDTIGGACRIQGKRYFVENMKKHASIIAREFPGRDITWSVHCHNDFGLAVENTINGVFHGPARQIEGCINGIGERAGNAALEQCIMIIKHFAPCLDPDEPFYTRADISKIQIISDFVSAHMLPRQPHYPVTGENAARHSSGGHTNAILRDRMAYQAFDPAEIGKEITLTFGPLSGGNHAKSVIERCGYICTHGEKAKIAQFIKDRYDNRRKGITEKELMEAYFEYRAPIRIKEFSYSRRRFLAKVTLKGDFFGESGEFSEIAEGQNSALAALKKAVDRKMPGLTIESHSSESAGHGIHATSVSTIVVGDNGRGSFKGIAEDKDIEISAMKALINAVNKAYAARHFKLKDDKKREAA